MKNCKPLIKLTFFVLVSTIISLSAFSQTPPSTWDTLPFKSYADYKLQLLNKTYVNTGVLYDRVFPIAQIDEHPGFPSTNSDTTGPDHLLQAYYEMYNSAYNTSGWLNPDTLDKRIQITGTNTQHPIGIFLYNFNVTDSNALQDHLLDTAANGQFRDVAGRPRTPYFTDTSFLASPLLYEDQVINPGIHEFYLDSNFFLHNQKVTIQQIRIDFGDGQGEWIVNNPFDRVTKTFAVNPLSATSFTSSILKNIVGTISGRIIVVIVDLLGHTIEYGNPFKIFVKNTKHYAALTTCKGFQKWVITADPVALAQVNALYNNPSIDYKGRKDTAYFYFAGNGSSCSPGVLHKPILFLDGFDPSNSRGVQQIYEDYINKSVTRNSIQVLFGDYMLSQGYDFIILDYKHGNDLMERNALTVVKLLQQLYQTYGSSFQQDITIIGPSMGAPIAQYALAYMEHNNIPTHVKTFIAFDGPMQGANVPIGLQNFVEYLTKRGVLKKIKSIREGLYNGLAARQLLAHHVSAKSATPAPDALRTKFLSNLAALGGYPSLSRKVSLIDGVSNGILNPNQDFNSQLLEIYVKRKGIKSIWGLCNANICKIFDWQCTTVPNYGTTKVASMWTLNPLFNLLFWVPPGNTNYYGTAAWNNSSLDNAPGGLFDNIFGTEPGNINETNFEFLLKESLYLITGSKRSYFNQNLNKFTFIPSYSSADLRFPTMTDNSGKDLNIDWSNTYLCGHTPFDYVYAPKDVNGQHVFVSQQGSEWFESEVRCSRADLPVLFNPIINGLTYLCSTPQSYSVSFCQTGNHNITWSVGNTSIVTISGSGDQISLTPHSNGITTLTATITYPCSYSSTPSIVLSKQITVGPPIITSISSTMTGSCNGSYQDWMLNAVANTPVLTWSWTVDNPANSGWIIYSPHSASTLVGVTGGGGITIKATNACGIGSNGVTIWSNCRYSILTASPNPATSDVTITMDQTNDLTSTNTAENSNTKKSNKSMYRIIVIDQLGVLKKQFTYPSGVDHAIIKLNGLIKGMYTIQAYDGAKWNSVKVIKE